MSAIDNKEKKALSESIKEEEGGIKINLPKNIKMSDFQGISSGVIGFIYLILIVIIGFIRFAMTRIKTYTKDMLLPKKNFKPYVLVPTLVILFIIVQGFINSNVLNGRCKNPMYIEAFTTALTTMTFIFGLIGAIIEAFPSWKRPFTNTIGHIASINKKTKDDIATKLFVPTFKKKDANLSEKIRKDINIILKEITPYNFQLFMNNLNVPVDETTTPIIIKFYNKLVKKDIIATTTWYILTIILVTTINMNTILGMPCEFPIKI
jgi:hypothetical protein